MRRTRLLRFVMFFALPLLIGLAATVASKSYSATVTNTIAITPGCSIMAKQALYGYPYSWFAGPVESVSGNCRIPIDLYYVLPVGWEAVPFFLDMLIYMATYYTLTVAFLGVSRRSAWPWSLCRASH